MRQNPQPERSRCADMTFSTNTDDRTPLPCLVHELISFSVAWSFFDWENRSLAFFSRLLNNGQPHHGIALPRRQQLTDRSRHRSNSTKRDVQITAVNPYPYLYSQWRLNPLVFPSETLNSIVAPYLQTPPSPPSKCPKSTGDSLVIMLEAS